MGNRAEAPSIANSANPYVAGLLAHHAPNLPAVLRTALPVQYAGELAFPLSEELTQQFYVMIDSSAFEHASGTMKLPDTMDAVRRSYREGVSIL